MKSQDWARSMVGQVKYTIREEIADMYLADIEDMNNWLEEQREKHRYILEKIRYAAVDKGWHKILESLFERMSANERERKCQYERNLGYDGRREYPPYKPGPQIVTIKEKFGSLRIYTSHSTDYTRGLIDMAEVISSHTCEVCGALGKKRQGSRIKTLCDEHAE